MTNEQIIEEFFCLKFELGCLAEITLRKKSERWIPDLVYPNTHHDHLIRYNFAATFTEGKNVLDAACGVGKGTQILASEGKAKTITAIDIDNEAIRYAKHRHSHPSIHFDVRNAEQFLVDNKVEVAVSFETIEHLKFYDNFLQNISKSLVEGGAFIISTPISALELDVKPANVYHVQEWGFLHFQNLVSKYFIVEQIFVQLHQNEVLNDKLRLEFPDQSLRVKYERSLQFRVAKRIFNLKSKVCTPVLNNSWSDESNNSKIERYNGQYPVEDLGRKYIGYQILILRKKSE